MACREGGERGRRRGEEKSGRINRQTDLRTDLAPTDTSRDTHAHAHKDTQVNRVSEQHALSSKAVVPWRPRSAFAAARVTYMCSTTTDPMNSREEMSTVVGPLTQQQAKATDTTQHERAQSRARKRRDASATTFQIQALFKSVPPMQARG